MALLAVALGSALVMALLAAEPKRIEYVPLPAEVVYVDKVVERVVPQVVYVPPQVVERVVEVETIIVVEQQEESSDGPPPSVIQTPVAPPLIAPLPTAVVEPPVVVTVCERRGKGQGHQHGVCRKQGFQ